MCEQKQATKRRQDDKKGNVATRQKGGKTTTTKRRQETKTGGLVPCIVLSKKRNKCPVSGAIFPGVRWPLPVGGRCPLEKILMGAAGQNDDLLSKCSQRAVLPPFFFIIRERDEEVVEERGGLCEMSYARREMPSRIGGDVCPTGTPLLWRP